MAPIKLVCEEVSLTEGPGRRAGIGRGWQCGTQVWFWSIFARQLWFTRVWVTIVWTKIVWVTIVWTSSLVLNRRHKTLHTKRSHLPVHSVFLRDPQSYYVELFHFFMSSFPRIFFWTWYLWPVNRKRKNTSADICQLHCDFQNDPEPLFQTIQNHFTLSMAYLITKTKGSHSLDVSIGSPPLQYVTKHKGLS